VAHPLLESHLLIHLPVTLGGSTSLLLQSGSNCLGCTRVKVVHRQDTVGAAILAVKLVEKAQRLRNTRAPHPFPPLRLGELQVP